LSSFLRSCSLHALLNEKHQKVCEQSFVHRQFNIVGRCLCRYLAYDTDKRHKQFDSTNQNMINPIRNVGASHARLMFLREYSNFLTNGNKRSKSILSSVARRNQCYQQQQQKTKKTRAKYHAMCFVFRTNDCQQAICEHRKKVHTLVGIGFGHAFHSLKTLFQHSLQLQIPSTKSLSITR
jgi:hypothetical protein